MRLLNSPYPKAHCDLSNTKAVSLPLAGNRGEMVWEHCYGRSYQATALAADSVGGAIAWVRNTNVGSSLIRYFPEGGAEELCRIEGFQALSLILTDDGGAIARGSGGAWLRLDGEFRTVFRREGPGLALSGIALTESGCIAVLKDTACLIDERGELTAEVKMRARLAGREPAVAPNGNIFFVTQNEASSAGVFGITPNGKVLPPYRFGKFADGFYIETDPFFTSAGELLATVVDSGAEGGPKRIIGIFDQDGKLLRKLDFGVTAVAPDGRSFGFKEVIVASGDNWVRLAYALEYRDSEGQLLWSKDQKVVGQKPQVRLIGSDGAVVVSGVSPGDWYTTVVTVFDNEGALVWRKEEEGIEYLELAVGATGQLYARTWSQSGDIATRIRCLE